MSFSKLFCLIFIFILHNTFCLASEKQNQTLLNQLVPNIGSNNLDQTEETTVSNEDIISDIVIKGNKYVSLKKIMGYLTIKKNDVFNQVLFLQNIKRLKSIGSFKNITHEVNDSQSGKLIVITVEEHEVIKKIEFIGSSYFTDEYLELGLLSKVGSPFNIKLARKDMQYLGELFKTGGLFESTVYKISKPTKDDATLTFYISEGIIEDIEITGNIRTRDYVVLREIDLRPGDILHADTIKSTIRKIQNLNFFESVEPDIYPSDQPNQYTLGFNLIEKETQGSLAFGGGYAPRAGFNLFSDLYWDNVFGSGQTLMLKGNFGLGSSSGIRNSTYQFKYHNPWAFGAYRSLTLRTWITYGSVNRYTPLGSSFRDEERKGFDIGVGIPHTYDIRTHHRLKYESVDLETYDLKYTIHSYAIGFSIDRRDLAVGTRKGYYHTLNIEKSFHLTSESLPYSQYDLILRYFIPTFKKQTIAFKSSFGYIVSPQLNNRNLFSGQYYYVGGSTTVRGYDDNSYFAYGNKQVVGNLEYRFLINTKFTFYFFVDTGFSTYFKLNDNSFEYRKYTDLSSYKVSKGIGVNFLIPGVGPIRLDFGIIDTGVSRIQFNMGYPF